jgi:hypothetical protein
MSASPYFPKPRSGADASGRSAYREPGKLDPVEEQAAPDVVLVQRAEPPKLTEPAPKRPKKKARKEPKKLTPEELQALLLATKGAASLDREARVSLWRVRLAMVPFGVGIGLLRSSFSWWIGAAVLVVSVGVFVREIRRST